MQPVRLNSDCRFMAGGSPQPRNDGTPFQQHACGGIAFAPDSARALQLKQLQSMTPSTQGSPLERLSAHPQCEPDFEDLKSEEEELELRAFAAKLDRYWKEAPPAAAKIRPNVSSEWLKKVRQRLVIFTRSSNRRRRSSS